MSLIVNIFTRQRVTTVLLSIYRSKAAKEMKREASTCFLQPISNDINAVTLPHGEVVYVGRNPETYIYDSDVSRKQIAMKANYDKEVVECVLHGVNSSGCNGYALKKDVMYTFKHGDRLEMILGKYVYEINFESARSDEAGPSKKFKVQDDPIPRTIALPAEIKGSWQFIDNSLLIYTPDHALSGNRVASFDMDGTLINTKSGQRFPKDNNDWMLAFVTVQQKMKDLFFEGYRIVIFSNQLKLGTEKQRVSGFKGKIENIITKLGIPIQAFIATQRDIYRKPAPGMWKNFLEIVDEEINVDESFYVGDAAGRLANWAPHKKKDHSIADRLFALNINIKFYTPEEYFLGARSVEFRMPEFDPRSVTNVNQHIPLSDKQEVILMVGCQGSGKSHFFKANIKEFAYVYINRDTLGNKQKCLKVFEACLQTKKSVVIDNTNPDVESREPFLELCQKYGVPCKCFYMDVTHQQCLHNNRFRSLTDKSHAQINDILINTYRKNFEEPSMDEGFSDIYSFKFNPVFENESEEKLYKMFLLES